MKRILMAALLLPHVAFAQNAVHWSHSGATGPDHWAELASDFELCATGRHQSPIDLADADGETRLTLNYKAVPLSIVNTGHTIQVSGKGEGGFKANGKTYDLVQGHFHTPGEHALGGRRYPLELHLVHSTADNELAVIGIMFQEGAPNPTLETIIANAPAAPGDPVMPEGSFDVAALLPGDRIMKSYSGSLTTPPCSENVAWFVFETPVTASAEQIAALARIEGENARPLQEVHARARTGPAD